jgi:hypothetical protein
VIAELVELVDVATVARALELETGFGGEHLVTQTLRRVDEAWVGGQQEGIARPGGVLGCGSGFVSAYEYGCSAHSEHGRPVGGRGDNASVSCPCTLSDEWAHPGAEDTRTRPFARRRTEL